MEPTPSRDPAPTGILNLVVRRPVAVLMVVLAVATFGLVSLLKLPVTLLPDVAYPTLTVRTTYPGAAPGEVEKLVTRPLEENLAVIGDLVSYRSISRAGVSDVILEFEWNTPMVFATQSVREKVDVVRSQLPQGIESPLILRYDPTLDPILRLALFPGSGSAADLYTLRRVAEDDIRRQIEGLDGVAAVRIRGGYEEEWRVELQETRLKQRGISASDVAQRIGLENANVAGGVLRDGDRESLVRTLGEIKTPDQLRDLRVGMRGGEPILVRDVGDVVQDRKERDIITRIDGRESVEIEIYKEASANLVEVAHRVKTGLYGRNWAETLVAGQYTAPGDAQKKEPGDSGAPRAQGDGPKRVLDQESLSIIEQVTARNLDLRLLSDQSIFVVSSIREVRDSALIGAGLAVLVLLAFLGRLGPTAIIGITIPISVVATFAPMFLANVTLNVMSLGGLALGVGMLVDSAIVVLESISRRRDMGEDPVTAAVLGTREVGLAVLASTLTTVAVFLPMVFVEGIAGEFFRDQALAVVFSLVASLIAALLFIPMLASRRFRWQRGGDHGLLDDAPWRLPRYTAIGNIRAAAAKGPLHWIFVIPFEAVLRFPLEVVQRTVVTAAAALARGLTFVVLALHLILRWVFFPFFYAFHAAYAGVEKVYGFLLGGALRCRFLVLAGMVALSFWAWTRVRNLGVELVPKVHQAEFTVETQLDVGTPVETTDTTSKELGQLIRSRLLRNGIAVSGITTSAGVPRDVIAKAGEGKHTSKVHVTLVPVGDLAVLEERAKDIIREAFAEVAGARPPIFVTPSLFSVKTGLEVEVIGPDLDNIRRVADRLEARMANLRGIADVQSTNRQGYPELVIVPDRQQLSLYDLNAGGVANLVRDKVQGAIGTRVSQGDRKIDVVIRIARDEVSDPESILDLRVDGGAADPIPLRTVAHLDKRPGPAEIRRVGGERSVIISAEVRDLDLLGAGRSIEEAVAQLEREDPESFREVFVRIAGQREESERSLQSMIFAGLIAVFLVYIVMASQFESLIHPFVILFTIPLALVGVVFALDALDIKVSVVVLIGVILLVGIVVNNAIVLVDAVNQRRRRGIGRDAALLDAARVRLRPILMTTLTTILGLVPLAMGIGEGSEIRRPMAITVIAGLATSTILTLVVIPVMYSLVSRPGPLTELPETAP